MSTKGVYTALSGAIAQSQRLDTIANNIANVNTPGFKRDQQVFKEYLTVREKEPGVMNVPRIPASVESFYDMQGGDKNFVDANGTFTDFSQGSLKGTGNPLDIAIDGKGFFEVATPQGVRWTRQGSFKIDGNGQLVTKDGHPVLKQGAEGDDPAGRVIRIQGTLPVSITDQGEILEGDQSLGMISLVDVGDKDHMHKMGGSLYTTKPNVQAQFNPLASRSVKQGYIEQSNVNIIQEMTDMIATTRNFESTQKAISAYDSMAEKLVNVVGKSTP